MNAEMRLSQVSRLGDGAHVSVVRTLDGIPYLTSKNIGSGRLKLDNLDYVSVEDFERLFSSTSAAIGRPLPGDILTGIIGTFSNLYLYKSSDRFGVSSAVAIIRPDRTQVTPEYLYYYLSSPRLQSLKEATASGSVQGYTNLKVLGALPIWVPPISEQQAIAEVLGALDDKIAANAKVASAAGSLATLTFRETARAVAFSASTFADIASVGGGGTPRTGVSEFWNGDVQWATPTDITALAGPYLESTVRTITVEGLANCSSPLYPRGSILMTSRATIGAFAIAQVSCAVNQGFIVVNPVDSELSWWFFHEMEDRVDEFVSLANGATFLELSRGRFKQLPVRLAEPGKMLEFCGRVATMHDVARQGLVENRSLATLRDTLLPRLMSGKIRVKDAEKQVEAVV